LCPDKGEIKMKKVKVKCPVVDYAFEEKGKIAAWVLDNNKLKELLNAKEKLMKNCYGCGWKKKIVYTDEYGRCFCKKCGNYWRKMLQTTLKEEKSK